MLGSYDPAEQTVACESKKKNRDTTVFPALDWLAALVTHIPDKGQRKGFITHTLLCH